MPNDFDLYVTSSSQQKTYGRIFRNVLNFKTLKGAQESVADLSRLYNYFERIGDRAGQHYCLVLALTGRNRARWSGKKESAKVFEEFLFSH